MARTPTPGPGTEEREKSRELGALRALLPFLAPCVGILNRSGSLEGTGGTDRKGSFSHFAPGLQTLSTYSSALSNP